MVGYENSSEVNFPASLLDANQTFLYVTPFFARMSFASEIAVASPSSVKEFTPTTWPPLPASSLLSASKSPSSPTHGLQVVNQKLTTVTLFPEKSLSLVTSLPSRSFPWKLGNLPALVAASALFGMPALDASTLSPELGELPHPGKSFSRAASLSSISFTCWAPVLSVFSSSAENWSLAPSIVSSRKSP